MSPDTGWTPDTPDPPETPLLDRIASLCLAAMAAIKEEEKEVAQGLLLEAYAMLDDEQEDCDECEWEVDIEKTAASKEATYYECATGCGSELKVMVIEETDDPDEERDDA